MDHCAPCDVLRTDRLQRQYLVRCYSPTIGVASYVRTSVPSWMRNSAYPDCALPAGPFGCDSLTRRRRCPIIAIQGNQPIPTAGRLREEREPCGAACPRSLAAPWAALGPADGATTVYWSSEFSLALLVPEVLARTVVMMAHAAGSPPTSAEPHGGISPL